MLAAGSVFMSSRWSGVASEWLASLNLQSCHESFPKITHYSVCDCAEPCVQVLRAVSAAGEEHIHVTRNIFELIDAKSLEKLKTIYMTYGHTFSGLKQECGNREQVENLIGSLEPGLCRECHEVLEQATFYNHMECVVCGQVPVKPPSNGFWIESISPTCTRFSSFGSGHGVIDDSNLPLWIWGYSMRRLRPDLIVLENIPRFNTAWWKSLLPTDYQMETLITCPPVVGVPCGGDRLFLKSWPSTTINLSNERCSFSVETFEGMFRRDVMADASLYLVADKLERREWHDEHCTMKSVGIRIKSPTGLKICCQLLHNLVYRSSGGRPT